MRVRTVVISLLATTVLLVLQSARAEECAKPTSASDIMGNLRSFGCNLGKGVKAPDPNAAPRKIVASGYIEQHGDAVCYEGEQFPTILKATHHNDGRVNDRKERLEIVLLPCDQLIKQGVLHPVSSLAATTGDANGAQPGERIRIAKCVGYFLPKKPNENVHYAMCYSARNEPEFRVEVETGFEQPLRPGDKFRTGVIRTISMNMDSWNEYNDFVIHHRKPD